MFAGSNFDAEDFDDYNVLQRDLKVDGGLRPVKEEEVIKIRNKAAKVLQALFKEMGFPQITDEEVEAATYAHGSKDMPDRNMVEDIKACGDLMKTKTTGVELIKALKRVGYDDVADTILGMMKLRVSGDHLHTSAIIDNNFKVKSAVNDKNDYMGPCTGYQMSDKRWQEVKDIENALSAEDFE